MTRGEKEAREELDRVDEEIARQRREQEEREYLEERERMRARRYGR